MSGVRVTVLGSGTSHGVPMIGCACATCRSDDPRDARLRPSIHIQVEDGPSILVDTSTDLRQQALRAGLTRVDAILFTHSHADHVMGFDEVRRFNAVRGGAIPIRADALTASDLRRTFAYVFNPPAQLGGGIPQVSKTEVETTVMVKDSQTIVLGGLKKDNKTQVKKGVPVLMDIPYLGKLFSSTKDTIESTEIVIFITPHIITGADDYKSYKGVIKPAVELEAEKKPEERKLRLKE